MTVIEEKVKEVLDRKCRRNYDFDKCPNHVLTPSAADKCWRCHENELQAREIADAVEGVLNAV